MTTTQLFKSSDAGAVALSGQAGKLIDVLDSVLVNGYNSQTVTSITRTGAVATVIKVGHGYRDGAVLAHAGADQAEYNVKARITRIDADTYTYPVSGTPASPATGTVTAKVAPAGWTKEFSGTNKAVYRPPQGARFYLRVLDDGSDASNAAKVAMIRGYESMSDVDTGTGPFPTAVQLSTGVFASKSTSADAAARPWMVAADEKRLVMFNAYSVTYADNYNHWGFGDLIGVSAADAYAAFIFGSSTTANAVSGTPGNATGRGNVAYAADSSGMYSPRSADGTGSAISALTAFPCAATAGSGINTFDVPLSNGDVAVDAIQVCNGSTNVKAPRGRFPAVCYVRNYLDSTYPTGTKLGQYEVVRYGGTLQSYLIDTGNWE